MCADFFGFIDSTCMIRYQTEPRDQTDFCDQTEPRDQTESMDDTPSSFRVMEELFPDLEVEGFSSTLPPLTVSSPISSVRSLRSPAISFGVLSPKSASSVDSPRSDEYSEVEMLSDTDEDDDSDGGVDDGGEDDGGDGYGEDDGGDGGDGEDYGIKVPIPDGFLEPANFRALGWYEQGRLVTKWKNEAVLKDLGIDDDLKQFKKKKKAVVRKTPTEFLEPTRKSSRALKGVSYNESTMFQNMFQVGREEVQASEEEGEEEEGEEEEEYEDEDEEEDEEGVAKKKRPSVKRAKRQKKENKKKVLIEDKKLLDATLPLHWFHFEGAPIKGNVGLKVEDLPPTLISAISEHLKDLETGEISTDTGEVMYYHVTPQSGKKGKNNKKFKGWQIQLWNPAVGSIVRLGLTNESYLGAIMVALADIDIRLFSQSAMYSFLYYVSTHGDAAVQKWLADVAGTIQFINPYDRKRKGGAPRRIDRKMKEADSFLNFGDDQEEAGPSSSRKRPRGASDRKLDIMAAASNKPLAEDRPEIPSMMEGTSLPLPQMPPI